MKLKTLGCLILGVALTGCMSFSVVSMSKELQERWVKVVPGCSSEKATGFAYLESLKQTDINFGMFIVEQGGLPEYVYVEDYKRIRLLYMGKQKLYVWDMRHRKLFEERDMSRTLEPDVLKNLPEEFAVIKKNREAKLVAEAMRVAEEKRLADEAVCRARLAEAMRMAEERRLAEKERLQSLWSGFPQMFTRYAMGEESFGVDVKEILRVVPQSNILDRVEACRFVSESNFTNRVPLYKDKCSGMTRFATVFKLSYPEDCRTIRGYDGSLKKKDGNVVVEYLFMPVQSIEKAWMAELMGVRIDFPESGGLSVDDLVGSLNAKYPGLKPRTPNPERIAEIAALNPPKTIGLFEPRVLISILENDDVCVEFLSWNIGKPEKPSSKGLIAQAERTLKEAYEKTHRTDKRVDLSIRMIIWDVRMLKWMEVDKAVRKAAAEKAKKAAEDARKKKLLSF